MTRKTEMKPPKILFFHKGRMPSAADYEESLDYGANVQWRNVDFVYPDEKLELCDGVAGEIPEAYGDLPTAEEALAAFRERIKAALGSASEEKAPRAKREKGGSKKDDPPAWNGPGAGPTE